MKDTLPRGAFPSTEPHRWLVQLCSVALCICDTRTCLITHANPALCKLLGYREDEIVGESFLGFLHPDDRDSAKATMCEAMEDGENCCPELRLVHRSGTVIHARFNMSFLQPSDQESLWAVATVEDITERRQHEQRLRVNEQRLEDALAMARLGSWTWDVATNSQWWSDAEYALLGLDPAKAKASHDTFLAVTHPNDRQWVEENFQAVLAGSDRYNFDTRVVLPSGEVRWLHTIAQIVRDDDGNVIQLVGTDQDISDRKATEEHLRSSEQKLRQLADAMPQVVWIANPDGTIHYVNQRGTTLFDRNALENPASLLHPEDGVRTKTQWDKSMSERSTFEVELRLLHGDAGYRWLLVRGVPILEADGSIARWYGTATDIHRLKATEEALRDQRERFWQSQKMEAIGRLAGGIAHDFNNLLTIVLGECEMMLAAESSGASPAHRRSLHAIRDAGLRASGLTKQLLTFGRRDRSKTETLDLNHETRQLAHLLGRMGGDAIAFRYELSDTTPWVHTDRTRLEQVLFNLVGNAVDAMPFGGLVRVRTSVLATHELAENDRTRFRLGAVELRVIDTGRGFTGETAERIFEPFFTTKDVGRGTGLGLAVVHGIVEQLGGRVFAASKQGETTFTILLPLSEPDPVADELQA